MVSFCIFLVLRLSVFYCHLYVLFCEGPVKSFYPVFIDKLVFLLICNPLFWICILSRIYMYCISLFSICSLPFYSFNGVFSWWRYSSFFFVCLFLRQALTLLPRLEYSGTITVHCNLDLPRLRWCSCLSPQVAGTYRGAPPHSALFCIFSRDRVSLCCPGWLQPNTVAHACNPNTLGGWGGRFTWGQEFETSLANMVKPHLY